MKNNFLILFIFLSYSSILSQIDSNSILNDKLFQLLEDATENIEEGEFLEIIEYLLQNPIDINTASISELLKLPFISPNDAKIIVNKRKEIIRFTSLYDLENIAGINSDVIVLIKPFITLGNSTFGNTLKLDNVKYYFRSRVKSDLQNREGFNNGNYEGSKLSFYNRIKITSENFNAGIITEKDAGEMEYYDHYAGFFQYKSKKLVQNVVIGDFNIEFGEGLALWSPYSFSKGSDAVNPPIKRKRNIIPHISSEENKHFRGAAVSLNISSSVFTGFYSLNSIAASLTDDNKITNFSRSGYYRTESEIRKKNNLLEKVLGFSYGLNISESFNIGVLHYQANYNKSFIFVSPNVLNGKQFSFTSVNYRLLLSKIMITGELANNTKAFSTLTNILIKLSPQIDILASYRNYDPQYYNIFSNGFGEFGKTQNEVGYYIGAKIKSAFGNFNLYYDLFKSPSTSYYSDFPVSGNEFLFHYDLKYSKSLLFSMKYKSENKEKDIIINTINEIGNEIKSNYRVELKYKLSKSLSGKSRIELVNFSKASNLESGFLSYQEIRFNIPKYFSVTSRIIFFETDSYNSRLYEFENDLRGVMSNFPLFGEGFRWYLLINYSLIENMILSLKYAETYKPNDKYIGSGNSQFIGNIDNRISLQIDYNY